MSTEHQGERQDHNSEGNQVTLEQLQAQNAELLKKIEDAHKSKERILNESKEYKEKYQSYKAKEDEYQSKIAREEEERLKKEGQFNVLLEQREQKIKELEGLVSHTKQELDSREESILNLKKASAFERQLGGKMKSNKYWSLVDFNNIAVNPDTGEIDKDSLTQYAGNFIKSHRELIDFGANGNLPNGTPNGGSGSLSYEQWQKLPLKDKQKRMKDVRL